MDLYIGSGATWAYRVWLSCTAGELRVAEPEQTRRGQTAAAPLHTAAGRSSRDRRTPRRRRRRHHARSTHSYRASLSFSPRSPQVASRHRLTRCPDQGARARAEADGALREPCRRRRRRRRPSSLYIRHEGRVGVGKWDR